MTNVLRYMFVLVLISLLGWGMYSVAADASGTELASPNDWITIDQISVYDDRISLDIPEAVLTVFQNSNSMDPVLDEFTHGIEIPAIREKLQVGDIISYQSSKADYVIVHRIISVEEDELGTYYTLQGDNNSSNDPQKVRFEEIKGVVVGLLY